MAVNTKLKTGIIGCGSVGHLHAKALRELAISDFCAVCGRDPAKTKAFAAQYDVAPFTDAARMIRESGVQAVVICTPHPVHAQSAIAALRAGAHVIVEKPLAASLADCDAILHAAKESGRQVSAISQRRFYPPCRRVKDAIDSGKLGRPVLASVQMHSWRDEAYYRSAAWRGTWDGEGGGVLINQAPHQLDLLLWYMGEVDEVYGLWQNLNHPYIEVEDTAAAVVKFKNGGIGNILVSNSQNPALYSHVRVFGENGASIGVQTDGGAMFIAGMSAVTEPPVNDLWTISGEQHMLDAWVREDTDFFASVDFTTHFFTVQLEDFLRGILGGQQPLVTGLDGRRTVELITGIYRSQRDGRPVRFPLAPEHGGDFDGRLPQRLP